MPECLKPMKRQHLKILVCVKQVPDIEAIAHSDDPGTWAKISESTGFRMNRYDEYAVEEAILLKEANPGTIVDILSVGPQRANQTIRRALGMGADNGIHIRTADDEYLSPFLIASWIAAAVRSRDYDLILAGVMSEDGMHGQVGPMTAEFLGIPCATSVVASRISRDCASFQVTREIEDGLKDLLLLHFPAVLSIQSSTNKPRYPALSKILRAKSLELEVIDFDTFDVRTSPERLTEVGFPQKTRSGEILQGSQGEKAAELLRILSRKIPIR